MPNMRKLIAAGFAVSAMMLSPASAADLMVKAKPVPIYDWTGFYAGVNVGYGWADRDLSFFPNDDATRLWSAFDGIPPPTSFNTSGALGGLQFGYNRQLGAGWLVGLEADFAWSGIKGSGISSGALPPVPIPGPYSAPFDERIDWFGTVRARLGYLPTSTLLTYVTGGLAYGQVTRSGSSSTIVPLVSQPMDCPTTAASHARAAPPAFPACRATSLRDGPWAVDLNTLSESARPSRPNMYM